jgi:hypothetical protein
MAKKKPKKETTVDRVVGGVETAATLMGDYLDRRYKIEKKVEDLKEKTEEKVEEIKKEAVHSAYEVKKGVIKTVIEIILLTTGIIALIIGVLGALTRVLPLDVVLLAYGLTITIIVLLQMKTR